MAAGAKGLRQAPKELATGMRDPDKTLFTETGSSGGKTGPTTKSGDRWSECCDKRRKQTFSCTDIGALALVTKMGHSPVGMAAAKVDALTRGEATVAKWAWPQEDIGSAHVLETPKGQKVGTHGPITTGGGQAAFWPWRLS